MKSELNSKFINGLITGLILFSMATSPALAAAPNRSSSEAEGNTSELSTETNLSADDWVQIKTLLPTPVTSQQAYLKASNTEANDAFGLAVSLSGDTLVVGTTNEDSNATGVNGNQADNSALNSGAVYVFIRVGGVWTQQAYLKASNTEADDRFGQSLSLSGDTLVVGAYMEDSNATGVNGNQVDNSALNSGAAYVFTRTGGVWSQQAYLKASNTNGGDYFGWAVSISGDTLVVGAYGEDSIATGVNGNQADNSAAFSGAAYIFTRSGTTWSQQAYLKASNTNVTPPAGFYDVFGTAVSVSGDTLVVGAYGEGSNATGVNGNQADNSAFDSGAAYVFIRSGNFWSQQAYLKASNTEAGDYFGYPVSLSGDTLAVGAYGEDSNAIGVNGNQANNSAPDSGAVYVFTRSGNSWSQQAYLKASNSGGADQFGRGAVSLSGDMLVVGAQFEDSNATGINGNQADDSAFEAGAAFIFNRSGGMWSQQAYLKASNAQPSDRFGSAVSVSGDTAIVGASSENSNAIGVNGNQADNSASFSGAAYVFVLKTLQGPFLDLPFQYTNFSEAAEGSNSGGYVNSWFDHTSPGNINAVGNLTTWLGPYQGNKDITRANCTTLGESCYNGHDGIDFKHVSDEVLAAAPGTVWKKGFETNGFGNYLYIDHGNCFASFYAHLKNTPTLQTGDPVIDRQQVGIMGNTGLSLGGGGGIHLHFGLYYDPTCDGDFTDKIVVDPYGWSGIGADPWTTGSSRYLWKYAYDVAQQFMTGSGGSAATPSGNLAVTIPAGAVVSPVTLELWNTPPVAGAAAALRSTGNAFWMRVLEWLTGSSSDSLMTSAATNSFDVPVTITVQYDPTRMPHLDTSQLTIKQWDDVGLAWVTLPTTLDTVNLQASAQTSQPGHFDLQAPLVCPADTLEPNDNYDGASLAQTDGTLMSNLFDIAQDEDWFRFNVVAGRTYNLRTTNLSDSVDTILEIYDTDGVTLLASDDNGGGENASSLTWSAPNNGLFFVRVKQAPGSAPGCSASYTLDVAEVLSYSLVWSDEFSGSFVDVENWNFEIGNGTNGWGNNELEYYTNGTNTSVANGELMIQARKENINGYQYTSTRMTTRARHEFQYGKIEARMKLPTGQGLWPAFWMLGGSYPVTPWPASGEIDIMEHINSENTVYGTVHWDDDGVNPPASYGCPSSNSIANLDMTKYHIYDIEWDPNSIRWYVTDDNGIRTKYCEINIQNSPNGTQEFHQPFFVLLNLAVGGNWPGSPDSSTVFPANMYVDYVRVYCSGVYTSIGGVTNSCNSLASGQSTRQSYSRINNGPVKITNTGNTSMIAAERVIYKANSVNTSFSEMMGLPQNQLDTTYYLPWYNNVDLDTQLRIANVSGSQATVTVTIGGVPRPSFNLAAGASTRVSYVGVNNGPVKIVSTHGVPIVAAERVIYKVNNVNTSFSETMALPSSQLNTTYWLPWYNNKDLDTQLRIANVSGSQATVTITIGGVPQPSFTLAAGTSTRVSYPGVNNGPVKIVSTQSIVAAERVIYKVNNVNTSFTEMMALPHAQLDTIYWLPWYNNVDLDTQLRIANISGSPATVTVTIGGVPQPSFNLAAGASTRISYPANNGPVKIVSTQNVVAAERVIYKVSGVPTSFSEMMGLPNGQLDTTYWLPWYNNVDLDTQLRFGVP